MDALKKMVSTSYTAETGGLLNPTQANKFFTTVTDLTAMKGVGRFETVSNGKFQISKLSIGERIIQPRAEGTAVSGSGFVTATPSLLKIENSSFTVPWMISAELMRKNIEQGTLETTVFNAITTQTANDVEDVSVNSDKTLVDNVLNQFDGWLKLAEGGNGASITDLSDKSLQSKVFSRMVFALPQKYRKNRTGLIFLVSSDDEQMYREKLSTKQTALGDEMTINAGVLYAYGIMVRAVPFIPQGTALLSYGKNFITCMDDSSISVLKDMDIYKNMHLYATHFDLGVGIENVEAVSFVTGLTL